MRKIRILLLLLCICTLSACGSKHSVSGKIIETSIDDEIGIVSFVIQTDENEETGIFMTDETHILTFDEGLTSEDFKAGPLTEVTVSVDCDTPHRTLLTQDGKEITAYNARQVEVVSYLKPEAAALADGTYVGIWQYSGSTAYALQNGIELLRVQNPTGPNNVYVGGIESFDDLGEAAQRNVLEFYQNQGLLYEEQAELEKAYANYLVEDDPSQFFPYRISQVVAPTASSETVMYFLTSVLLPVNGAHDYKYRIGAAFDRTTGEPISSWDLFSCTPKEAIQKILDMADIHNPALRTEMEQAFHPENMIFFPENFEISFPQGTLPSQEHTYMLGLDYDEGLSEILHEWAIPASPD